MADLLLGTPNTYKSKADLYDFNEENDLQFSPSGRLILVEKSDKLKQSIAKILLTDQGSSAIESRYGTVLNSYIGTAITSQPTYALIKQTIIDALGMYVALYEDSEIPEEIITTLESIDLKIVPDVNNMTRLVINLTITDPNSTRSSITVTL